MIICSVTCQKMVKNVDHSIAETQRDIFNSFLTQNPKILNLESRSHANAHISKVATTECFTILIEPSINILVIIVD